MKKKLFEVQNMLKQVTFLSSNMCGYAQSYGTNGKQGMT